MRSAVIFKGQENDIVAVNMALTLMSVELKETYTDLIKKRFDGFFWRLRRK